MNRSLLPLSLGGLLLLAAPATADVLLHPGKLVGTVRLEPWTFGPSSVHLSANPNGFSASTEWSGGDSFELTTEGNQTYRALSLRRSFLNGNFSLSAEGTYLVPADGTLTVDLSREGGTFQHKVEVQGGRLVSASYGMIASDYSRNESYSSVLNQPGDQPGLMPMVAHDSIHTRVSALVAVFDGGGAELCQTKVDLPYHTLSLAPGEVKPVTHALTVTPEQCSSSLEGTVEVHGEPSGAEFTQALVQVFGASQLKQFWVPRSTPTWRLDGLTPGNYTLAAAVYYQPPSGSDGPRGSLLLPNYDPPSVNVAPGQRVTRNFIFGSGSVSGAFVTTNALALRFISQSVGFTGQYRYGLPNGGPSAGGHANFRPRAPYDRTFKAVLTPGEWGPPVANFSFQDEVSPPQTYSLSYFSYAHAPFFMQEGQSVNVPTVSIANSVVLTYFDVAEAPNTPQVLLSNPTLYGSRYHSLDNDHVSATFRRLAKDRQRIAVKFVGPRGRYELKAYASVRGSWTKFSGSVLDIGTAVATPSGFQVLVKPQDSQGGALPLTVQFSSVQQEGQTTASFTDLGPVPPEGYRLLQVTPGTRYLSLASTAAYSGDVELAVSYDPVALGLSPEQESQLVLQQYFCEETDEENCRWVPLSASPETYGFGVDALVGTSTRASLRARTWTMGMVALTLPVKRVDCKSSRLQVDDSPPSLQVEVTPAVLWPPDHTSRPITLSTRVEDQCDPHPTVSCAATSNEPDDGQGDGDSSGDIVWKDGQLFLRAERSGTGTGRVYTLTCTARDASANTVTRTAEVRVPRSASGIGTSRGR
jgi:hypothetical protein